MRRLHTLSLTCGARNQVYKTSVDYVEPYQKMDCVASTYIEEPGSSNLTASRFWGAYRDITCNIYPVVADMDAFENTLNYLLMQRTEHQRQGIEIDATKPYGVSMPWLALLFAVLASGAQSTSRTAKERELTSQVYSKFTEHNVFTQLTNSSLLFLPSTTNGEFLISCMS